MKKILVLVVTLGLVIATVGAGTAAIFTDTAASSPNTFTSGTLNMVLSGGTQDGDSVMGTWVSPANWKPGEVVNATLAFTNKGSVDAKHIYFILTGRPNDGKGDGSNLMNAILVTNIQERFNAISTGNQALTIAHQVGDRNDVLTLKEFVDFNYGSDAYYTVDDKSGDGVVIADNDKNDYALTLGLTFDPNAGNEYQGDTCGFSMRLRASQNSPTDGLVKLHE